MNGILLGATNNLIYVDIFGVDFPDKELWSVREDVRLYRSEILEKLWPYGFVSIGDVTFNSAAYVARYCCKVITGDDAVGHYQGRSPEFALMSRRPGIGKGWFETFAGDCFPKDYVTLRGVRMSVPKYYDYLYDIADPDEFEKVKAERRYDRSENEDATLMRLMDREAVKFAQYNLLKRGVEND